MGNVGIIAEYNPFHNGHKYQIEQIRRRFPDKQIVVAMSGNYVQRGEPAVFHKHLRAAMALSEGADMVLELPSVISCQSAEYFARGAVSLLAATGLVDTLCFGSECDDMDCLTEIADLLINEPAAYRQILKEELSCGISFPKARSVAVSRYLGDTLTEDILTKPNNILAIEYIKSIRFLTACMKPIAIKRTEDNYHDTGLSETICSATALRYHMQTDGVPISNYLPKQADAILQSAPENRPLFLQDFYPFIQNSLWNHRDSYELFADVSSDFANRLRAHAVYPENVEDFIDALSNKTITGTRIRRNLLHILLRITKDNLTEVKNNKIPYIRLLGFHRESDLPRQMKTACKVPVITKPKNAERILDKTALSLFEAQLQMDDIYRQAYRNKYGKEIPSEYCQTVIRA